MRLYVTHCELNSKSEYPIVHFIGQDGIRSSLRLVEYRPFFYITCATVKDVISLVNYIRENIATSRVLVKIKSISNLEDDIYCPLIIDEKHQPPKANATILSRLNQKLCNVLKVEIESYHNRRSITEHIGRIFKTVKFYETNVDPLTHAILHLNIRPCCWSDYCDGVFRTVDTDDSIPPLNTLVFDIETLTTDGSMDMSKCYVIQISVIKVKDALSATYRCEKYLFTQRKCDPLPVLHPETVIFEYKDERALLTGFMDYCKSQPDVDVISGYNIKGFDLVVLFDRFAHYKITPYLSRITTVPSTRTEDNRFQIPGVVIFDLFKYVMCEQKFPNNRLGTVAKIVLGEDKGDVKYEDMQPLFDQGPDGVAKIGDYCVQDSLLVQKIQLKLNALTNQIQLSKVAATILEYVVNRGQQVRQISMLLKYCIESRTLITDFKDYGNLSDTATATPVYSSTSGVKRKKANYTGAFVLEPKKGLYTTPVLCLDFASLYPSIMIAYNLCYTTLLLDTDLRENALQVELAEVSPENYCFLKSQVRAGILPRILTELTQRRASVKREMIGVEKSSFEYKVKDALQLAFKTLANSVYGTSGASQSKLFCVQIPASVTSYGRQLLMSTKNYVEERNHKVIYGDTDSVMLNVSSDENESIDGRELANSITEYLNRKPIRLEFETLYCPYLILKKKKYVAVKQPDNKLTYKGLEIVRRDHCQTAVKLQKDIIDVIFRTNGDVEECFNTLKRTVQDLYSGKISLSQLSVSKRWKSYTKTPTVHSSVARKMKNRGNGPRVNDNIDCIILSGANRSTCDKAEELAFAVNADAKPDLNYYYRFLLAPSLEIIKVLLKDDDEIKKFENRLELCKPDNFNKFFTPITRYFKPKSV